MFCRSTPLKRPEVSSRYDLFHLLLCFKWLTTVEPYLGEEPPTRQLGGYIIYNTLIKYKYAWIVFHKNRKKQINVMLSVHIVKKN